MCAEGRGHLPPNIGHLTQDNTFYYKCHETRRCESRPIRPLPWASEGKGGEQELGEKQREAFPSTAWGGGQQLLELPRHQSVGRRHTWSPPPCFQVELSQGSLRILVSGDHPSPLSCKLPGFHHCAQSTDKTAPTSCGDRTAGPQALHGDLLRTSSPRTSAQEQAGPQAQK